MCCGPGLAHTFRRNTWLTSWLTAFLSHYLTGCLPVSMDHCLAGCMARVLAGLLLGLLAPFLARFLASSLPVRFLRSKFLSLGCCWVCGCCVCCLLLRLQAPWAGWLADLQACWLAAGFGCGCSSGSMSVLSLRLWLSILYEGRGTRKFVHRFLIFDGLCPYYRECAEAVCCLGSFCAPPTFFSQN